MNSNKHIQEQENIVLATAQMGFGHLRAIYPLSDLLNKQIITLGQNDGSKWNERFLWWLFLTLYESISRTKNLPIIGSLFFSILNKLLEIPKDKTNQSKPSIPVKILETFIRVGLCKGFLKAINNEKKIVITSFYAPAIAVYLKKNNLVFCQICDTDLSRAWVSKNPKANNVHYFAPCSKVGERLILYGVEENKIHLTGFPFPNSLVGGKNEDTAISNYSRRLNLFKNPWNVSQRPLEIAFILGGAGAQYQIGEAIAQGLSKEIESGKVILNLIPGIRKKQTKEYIEFKRKYFNGCENLKVIASDNLSEYFISFNKLISTIDILWTKPSELTFYSALGIPIIMTEPIGPQEIANREWLLNIGAGCDQGSLKYVNFWLFKMLHSGELSKMAQNGWNAGNRTALYKTLEIVTQIQS